jgi:hypothetical protein
VEHNTLLVDGHGQGDEGTHDAWSKIPYTQLNEARLVSVKADAQGFEFVGEAAGVYEAALGLTQFRRALNYTSGKLVVTDTIASSKPGLFTEVLHSDRTIVADKQNRWEFRAGDATLQVALEDPAGAVSKIEPNVVMGPGQPGSVDKGTPEARGERVLVSTEKPEIAASYQWVLTF